MYKFAVKYKNFYMKSGNKELVVQGSLYDAKLFNTIDEALDYHFLCQDKYALRVCRDKLPLLKVVLIEVMDDYFNTRKIVKKLDILIRQIYKITYKLHDGSIYSGSTDITVYKVLNHDVSFTKFNNTEKYNNYDLAKFQFSQILKKPHTRQLGDLIGTIYEKDIPRLQQESLGEFNIIDAVLEEEVIL